MNLRSIGLRSSGFLFTVAAVLYCGLASTATAQNADLAISKSTSNSIVAAGSDVTYEVDVSNFSGDFSTPTNTVSDVVPANMTFISGTHPDGWTCTAAPVTAGNTITCTSDTAIFDESIFAFTFTFHVDPSTPNDTIIDNTATISHAGSDPNSSNNSSTARVTVGVPPPPPTPIGSHDVLISEFRLSGPGGASDEYVEFYCNRDTDCDISGFTIRTYDPTLGGDFSATFPASSIIPARQYALLVSDITQYSLSDYALPDFTVSDSGRPDFFIDNQGVQLVAAEEGLIIDSIGFNGGGNQDQYVEGTGLQPATAARPADQYAYVRRRGTETDGRPQDTNNNANDLGLASVTGSLH